MAIPPKSRPLAVTVHDLAFVDYPEHATRHGLRFFHRSLVLTKRDADVMLCPSVSTKAELVAYLKGSIAYAKKAAAFVNQKNMMDPVKSPFGNDKQPRLNAISIAGWHSMDHYGQMVVYARLNGIKPGR